MRLSAARPPLAWVLPVLTLGAVTSMPALAGLITASSYTINTPTETPYPDDTGSQLTDGSFGTTDLVSAGAAVPWVGWINTNAIFLTFNFAAVNNITAVGIDFLKETQNFAFLPDFVSVNGQLFAVDPNALPNSATGFIIFSPVGLNTQTVNIEIDRASTGFHILIDEVEFNGSVVTSGAAPEPATLPLMGTALLGLAAVGRRL